MNTATGPTVHYRHFTGVNTVCHRWSITLLLMGFAAVPTFASIQETEPNSTVTGVDYVEVGGNPLIRQVCTIDTSGQCNPAAPWDPRLATELSTRDEMVGQLNAPRDYDWYWFRADGTQAVTPAYFGCNHRLGHYWESLEPYTVDATKDLSWQVEYYRADASSPTGAVLQSSYVVYPEACRRGTAETKGPFRFQMDTRKAGLYYVRVWGRLVASGKDFKDTIVDNTGTEQDRHTYYDIVVNPTADYSLRLYTAKVGGELEPNDGMQEAYQVTPGVPAPGQLASMYDKDVFAIDNAADNSSGKLNMYFSCKGQSTASYLLSTYNNQGILQTAYEVPAGRCNSSDGFAIALNTPSPARYFLEVSSPTYADGSSFSQGDYTVTVLAKGSRLPGEMEPNDTRDNAYPLTKTETVTAQLASAEDLDYYYLDVSVTRKSDQKQSLYFGCGEAPTGSYIVSFYNTSGSLQKNYLVSPSQCQVVRASKTSAVKGGFQFQVATPQSGRYYVQVSGPGSSGNYSDADYTLSTFLDMGSLLTDATSGVLSAARIVDNAAANRDNFVLTVARCGQYGNLRLVGRRLNLSDVDSNTQVLLQIGGWSCVSDTKALATTRTDTTGSTYVWPVPEAVVEKPVPPPRIMGNGGSTGTSSGSGGSSGSTGSSSSSGVGPTQ